MFSNFLYFLVALIIYTTSEFFQVDQSFELMSIFYSIGIGMLFFMVCQTAFIRLENHHVHRRVENMDYWVNKYIARLSILALMVFSVIIYTLRPQQFFLGVTFFDVLPTARAIIFIGVFLSFLVMIWNCAYRIQKRFFAGNLSKKDYIFSNISFSLPALLPWFVISIIADILGILPWTPVKELLQTPAGEVGYIAMFLVAIAVFGPVLIKRLWKCRPLEAGHVRQRIENICKTAGLEYADILRWELFGGTMITAGVMGLVARFRYILVTPALYNSLNEPELDAVMLHEIGHVQKYHMLFYLVFLSGFFACSFVLFEPILQVLRIVQPIYTLFESVGIGRETAYSILITSVMIGSFVLCFRFVFGLFMRNFERQADLHVYQFSSNASALISTFYKIASFSRQSIDKPNWHHYSIGQRIRFLEKCQTVPSLIAQHHTRVKRLIGGYVFIVIGVFFFGYSINYGAAKPAFDTFIAQKTEAILFARMDIEPDNSALYVMVGDYYYLIKKNYQKAIDSYENVLRVDPLNVHALNNLSWLFVTCPDKTFHDAQKALVYAKKAVAQTREPFILDTYAEALFANNDVENAVKMTKEALRLSKTKKVYYQGQLTRFEKVMSHKISDQKKLDPEKT